MYTDEYGEREEKNPFFIGQVKILTIHLKREFNKPVDRWKFRHPKAIVERSSGVDGNGVGGGRGLMLYLDVRLGLIVRVARVQGCVVQHNGTPPMHIGHTNNALK
jgi:hypothetical protein